MPQTTSTDRDLPWNLLLAASQSAERMAHAGQSAAEPDAIIAWRFDVGWENRLPPDDPRSALLDLYLPICSATSAHPVTVGHLGQSLDGFIATHAGESRWVTGQENIVHLHRLRALCDAVIVGAGTVAADNPQLTTRLVPGPNPLRVVLDPTRRLTSIYRVFNDDAAETMYACARSLVRAGEDRVGRATVIGLPDSADGVAGVDLAELVHLLRARGCTRIFVEGGGVTVSMFLAANLLDRLHVAIAPLIIGDGKPAIRLPPRAALGDCHRPRYRVFRMGGDVLFDCEINTRGDDNPAGDTDVVRVI
jgi:riboflavin-specific deaminase-like protein